MRKEAPEERRSILVKEKIKKITVAVTGIQRCAGSVDQRTVFLHAAVLTQKGQERYL
jgi:hypothetical protein